MIALSAPFIATEKPWYVKYKNHHLFPAFTFKNQYVISDSDTGEKEIINASQFDWKSNKYENVIWAPVPYSPGKTDIVNFNYKSPFDLQWERENGVKKPLPFRFRHWLGTNAKGEDVLSELLNGTRTSLFIGIFSIAIAGLIGIVIGCIAGYFANERFILKRYQLVGFLFGIILGIFYSTQIFYKLQLNVFYVPFLNSAIKLILTIALFLIVLLLCLFLFRLLKYFKFFNSIVEFNIDLLFTRVIEIFISIPKLILIITLASVFSKSLINLILIIGLTSWTGIALLVRAEMIRIKSEDYMNAAKVSGLSLMRIIFKHGLPNAIGPALVSMAFGVSSAIIAESGLSFLGMGLPHDIPSWGSILSDGRSNFKAWWLTLFPGLSILIVVLLFNFLGEGIQKSLKTGINKLPDN